jgi:hypothetical protein
MQKLSLTRAVEDALMTSGVSGVTNLIALNPIPCHDG